MVTPVFCFKTAVKMTVILWVTFIFIVISRFCEYEKFEQIRKVMEIVYNRGVLGQFCFLGCSWTLEC